MKLLDLFCGAGGASVGYNRAGFDVSGVDINPQPNYPFRFYQADALTFPLDGFDIIHASPPCQKFTYVNHYLRDRGKLYPDYISPIRSRLKESKKIYIIENVGTAGLKGAFKLCGSSFGLDVRRHRFFECPILILVPQCNHKSQKPRFKTLDWKRRKKNRLACVVGVHGSTQYKGDYENRCAAMGIDWMTNAELVNAIPPAYTQFIGEKLLKKTPCQP